MIIASDPSERQSDVLKTVLSLHAIALDGMAEGLCVVDGELRIVLFNRRFAEMLGLPKEAVKLGASLKSVMEQVSDPGAASRDRKSVV